MPIPKDPKDLPDSMPPDLEKLLEPKKLRDLEKLLGPEAFQDFKKRVDPQWLQKHAGQIDFSKSPRISPTELYRSDSPSSSGASSPIELSSDRFRTGPPMYGNVSSPISNSAGRSGGCLLTLFGAILFIATALFLAI